MKSIFSTLFGSVVTSLRSAFIPGFLDPVPLSGIIFQSTLSPRSVRRSLRRRCMVVEV